MSRWGGSLLAVLALVSCCVVRRIEAGVATEPPPKLELHHYQNSCPDAESYVRAEVERYWNQDKSLAPKFIQILYTDCFITGCDASVLLDGPNSEKTAPQNKPILGFPEEVIDKIKEGLEQRCPGVVSCADIIILAARDATHLAGGGSYQVLTGRRDGMSSSAATVDLPLRAVPWEKVVAYFQARGLDVHDMTTLLGGHSMGKTHCRFIADRLYNFNNTGKPDPSMDPSFLEQMKKLCPPNSESDVYLDPDSGPSYSFDKNFYARVLKHQAVLGIDQQIALNNESYQIAQKYDASFEDFQKMFGLSINRMGNIKVLTGSQGEIRKNCRLVNGK